MADTTVKHKLELLIHTKLDDAQKAKVGKDLKAILEGAAIGFNEAETQKNLKPIINMVQKMFEKAEMKFDADKLLAMPSQEALQELANITAERFQAAFDRALERSGGVKIELGDVNLSGMTEPLERVVEEVAKINRRLANETKKSVDEIEREIKSLDKQEDNIKKKATPDKIEKTLSDVSNQKKITSQSTAITALEKAAGNYHSSVQDGDPWAIQYQHLLDFVSKYEAMSKKIKPLVDAEDPKFKALYDILSPKAGAAKISLENFVSVSRGEEPADKNQPWAKESTLKNIEKTLKGGIAVKGDGGDSHDDEPKEPSKQVVPEQKPDDKKINSKGPIDNGESDAERAARLAREQEEAALREAERKRLEQERIAEAERAAAAARRVAEEKAIAEARKVYAENIYRVVFEPDDEEDKSRDERKEAYGGVEIWTSSKDVARTYADGMENPAMLHGSVSAKNAYLIDAGGAKWNEFSKMKVLTPVGVGDKGKPKFDKAYLKSVFPELFKRVDNKEFQYEADIQAELYRLIKNLGYDSIITSNVVDTNNVASYSAPSTIYSIIDDKILKVIDAFAVEEQDKYGITFEETPRRENIPEYYKMPAVTNDDGEIVSAEELELQKQILKIKNDINAASESEGKSQEEQIALIEKYYKLCVKLGNAKSEAVGFEGAVYNKSELGDFQSKLRGLVYNYTDKFGEDASVFKTKKLQKIFSDGVKHYQSVKPHVDELNKSLEKKSELEASDNSSVEVVDTNAQTEAYNKQNEELKENIQLKERAGDSGTRGLLPSADGLEAHTYAPSDDQKEYVLKIGEEYRAIMEILERGDSELESALIERARAISDIMLNTVRGSDGFLGHEYENVYGGSRKTAASLDDWKQRDLFLHNVDSNKIDDSQRRAAIDLIYQEIEAEKQLEETRRRESAEKQKQELDTFKDKYTGASEEEKKLLYEIIELEKEYRRLYDIGNEESHEAAMETLSQLREKEIALEKLNADLMDAYDRVGVRAEPFISVPTTTSVPAEEMSVDTTEEQTQLSNLKTAVSDVTTEIGEKTQAFVDEERKVKEVVGHEIEALGTLENKISAIKGELNRLTESANTDIGSEFTINVNHKAEDVEGSGVSINQEELKSTLDGLIYKVKFADGDGNNESKVSINSEELKSVLDNIVFDVKVVESVSAQDNKPISDDGNKPVVDDKSDRNAQWENDVVTLLTRIKVHTHNTVRQVRDSVVPKMGTGASQSHGDWAKETTLDGKIGAVLNNIQTNTNRIAGPSDPVHWTSLNSSLVGIVNHLSQINNKISGKISGVVKSDEVNPDGKPAKNKDGSISHGKAEGATGSMQKLFDYYYWIEEQIEQFKSNEMYVAELQKVQARIIPQINAYYEELEKSGQEYPAWMAPLDEKHNLHMSKIRGGEANADSTATEKKALDLLKEEYKLKKEIFALEQRGATRDDIAPLQEKLGIYQSIRETIEFNMTDNEILRYATSAAKEVDKGENQLSVKQIAANIQARKASAIAENNAIKAADTYVAKLQKEMDELRAVKDSDQTDQKVKDALQEEIDLRQKLIDLKRQGLEVDGESEAYQKREAKLKTDAARAEVAQQKKDNKKSAADADSAIKAANQSKKTRLMALAREVGTKEAELGVAEDGSAEYQAIKKNIDDIIKKIDEETSEENEFNNALKEELKTTREIAKERKARSLSEASARKDAREQLKADLAANKKNASANKVASSIRSGRDALFTASTLGVDESLFVANKDIDKLTGSLQELMILESQLAENDWVLGDDEDGQKKKKRLAELTGEVNKYSAAVKALVANSEKFGNENSISMGATLNGSAGVKDQLLSAARSKFGSNFRFEGYNEDLGEIVGTLKVGAKEYQKVTIGANQFTKEVRASQGPIKKTETLMESFKRKLGEISTYFSASTLIFKAVSTIKQAVSYVREIDLALTELKKVTSETEEVYDKFLETAAKTGARLGTTISAVTEATATFAKLGYTMEQATEMAEAAIVYKNVGDNIASTEDAADSIISTLKGFGLEASESMAIVDKFNEVGNRFAITSQGIGEALRLSASALNEGGNSLDESIAMITAAMSNWLFVQKCTI